LSVPDLPTQDLPAEDLPAEGLAEESLLKKTWFQEHLPQETLPPENLTAEHAAAVDALNDPSVASPSPAESPEPIPSETSHTNRFGNARGNAFGTACGKRRRTFLPFRPIGEAKPPSLTPVENSAFNELARQLSERLETEIGADAPADAVDVDETVVEPQAAPEMHESVVEPPAGEKPDWLAAPEAARRTASQARQGAARFAAGRRADLTGSTGCSMPTGVFWRRWVIRACMRWRKPAASMRSMSNPASRTPPARRHRHAGDDFREPARRRTCAAAGGSMPVSTRSHGTAIPRLALIFSGPHREAGAIAAAIAEATPLVAEPSPVGHADAEELGAILDTTAEGIVMFDAEGNINSANRSAEALFGYDGAELAKRNLADLFAPESQHAVFDNLASINPPASKACSTTAATCWDASPRAASVPLSMDDGADAARRAEFLCRVPRSHPGQEDESELREARAAGRSRRQRQGRRAGAGSATRCARRSMPSSALPKC